MRTPCFSTTAITTALINISLATSSSSCYYPSGALAPDVPCDTSTTGHSACCGKGVECLSSGLCFDEGVISRGSCTDLDFADGACAEYCTDHNPTGGAPIIINQWASDNNVRKLKWCCGFPFENNGTCKQSAAIRVTAGTVVAIAGGSATSTAFISASSTATSMGVSSSSAIPTEDASNLDESSSSEEKCRANKDVAIGTGLGVPLCLAALAMMGLFLRERKMRKKERLEGDMQRGLHSGYGNLHEGHVGSGAVSGVPIVVDDRKDLVEIDGGRRVKELP
ncbi:hypothetical protein BKA65DRAFT_559835 [Rhexocercosporidium sp. MPI-PUGE-AT-0058]|nr:hypothetical protein BKA65DRAFT_559835 [Rhexocercosporidium sp. MPI-PUGE-AT-0058]